MFCADGILPLSHDLQVREVHLLREATPFSPVALLTKEASVPKATGPILTGVSVLARLLPRNDLQSVQLLHTQTRSDVLSRAWRWNPRALAMKVILVADLLLTSVSDEPL